MTLPIGFVVTLPNLNVRGFTFNPTDFVTIFEVLGHFHIRAKTEHTHFINKCLLH